MVKGEEGKVSGIKWGVVCSPIKKGGLGIKKIEVFNK